MQITPVTAVVNPIGLEAAVLNALVPNQSNYRVLLMQPRGQIEASAAGVRNRDRGLARRQFGSFLQGARECHGDLVITPEYSMPWDILVEALEAGSIPSQGRLWALGCESITLGELEAVKQRLAPHASVIYEPLVAGPERFTDPLAYVFVAQPVQGDAVGRVVVLVQFKTCPMADDDHFELNGLQLGTLVYQFGGI